MRHLIFFITKPLILLMQKIMKTTKKFLLARMNVIEQKQIIVYESVVEEESDRITEHWLSNFDNEQTLEAARWFLEYCLDISPEEIRGKNV